MMEWIGYGLGLVFGTLAVLEVGRNLMGWWRRPRVRAKRVDLETWAVLASFHGWLFFLILLGEAEEWNGGRIALPALVSFVWMIWANERARGETRRKHEEDCEAAYDRGFSSGRLAAQERDP